MEKLKNCTLDQKFDFLNWIFEYLSKLKAKGYSFANSQTHKTSPNRREGICWVLGLYFKRPGFTGIFGDDTIEYFHPSKLDEKIGSHYYSQLCQIKKHICFPEEMMRIFTMYSSPKKRMLLPVLLPFIAIVAAASALITLGVYGTHFALKTINHQSLDNFETSFNNTIPENMKNKITSTSTKDILEYLKNNNSGLYDEIRNTIYQSDIMVYAFIVGGNIVNQEFFIRIMNLVANMVTNDILNDGRHALNIAEPFDRNFLAYLRLAFQEEMNNAAQSGGLSMLSADMQNPERFLVEIFNEFAKFLNNNSNVLSSNLEYSVTKKEFMFTLSNQNPSLKNKINNKTLNSQDLPDNNIDSFLKWWSKFLQTHWNGAETTKFIVQYFTLSSPLNQLFQEYFFTNYQGIQDPSNLIRFINRNGEDLSGNEIFTTALDTTQRNIALGLNPQNQTLALSEIIETTNEIFEEQKKMDQVMLLNESEIISGNQPQNNSLSDKDIMENIIGPGSFETLPTFGVGVGEQNFQNQGMNNEFANFLPSYENNNLPQAENINNLSFGGGGNNNVSFGGEGNNEQQNVPNRVALHDMFPERMDQLEYLENELRRMNEEGTIFDLASLDLIKRTRQNMIALYFIYTKKGKNNGRIESSIDGNINSLKEKVKHYQLEESKKKIASEINSELANVVVNVNNNKPPPPQNNKSPTQSNNLDNPMIPPPLPPQIFQNLPPSIINPDQELTSEEQDQFNSFAHPNGGDNYVPLPGFNNPFYIENDNINDNFITRFFASLRNAVTNLNPSTIRNWTAQLSQRYHRFRGIEDPEYNLSIVLPNEEIRRDFGRAYMAAIGARIFDQIQNIYGPMPAFVRTRISSLFQRFANQTLQSAQNLNQRNILIGATTTTLVLSGTLIVTQLIEWLAKLIVGVPGGPGGGGPGGPGGSGGDGENNNNNNNNQRNEGKSSSFGTETEIGKASMNVYANALTDTSDGFILFNVIRPENNELLEELLDYKDNDSILGMPKDKTIVRDLRSENDRNDKSKLVEIYCYFKDIYLTNN